MATLKILVIDDEPGIRSGISRILQNFRVDFPFMDEPIDFTITDVASGEEGMELLTSESFDILLLDNKLPGMQGIEVLERIRKQGINVLVAMITSYASLELAVKATRDGAFDFIPKPFTANELRSSIENISKHLFLKRMTSKLTREGRQIRFQFLSVLSHELKAPLNSIEGYLQFIKERKAGDDINAYDNMVSRSLERIRGMRNLIMDMLDLTKLESGKTISRSEPLDLKEIAQVAVDSMRPYAIQKDVDIYINQPIYIEFHAVREEMEIIFNNLISNAVKYNKQGGRVDCNITRNNSKGVVISVSDTGIGLSEEEIQRIFEEFYRVKNPETKSISGSGLGLSIMKKIVEMYNGHVDVKSTPGKGSTFTVTLPFNQQKTK